MSSKRIDNKTKPCAKDCSQWAIDLVDQMESPDIGECPLVPDAAPDWVHSMTIELVKLMNPTTEFKKTDSVSAAAWLGSLVGHQKWQLEHENGLHGQIDRLDEMTNKALDDLASKFKDQISKEQLTNTFTEMLEKAANLTPDLASFIDGIDPISRHRQKWVDKCMTAVAGRPLAEQSEFFDAYAKALKAAPMDEKGIVLREKFPGTTNIYTMMITHWQHVESLPSLAAVHAWLCKIFGETLIGSDLSRVKGIAKRFGIKLASRGRPKKMGH